MGFALTKMTAARVNLFTFAVPAPEIRLEPKAAR
jgi:hypothetical protein